MVRIAHAVSDEEGKSSRGKAGDQTAREVRIQEWYDRAKGWSYVFRARADAEAEKIAESAEKICKNEHIGYDQSQRTTLWNECEKVAWDATKIKNDCETDCSAMVAVCVKSAGIDISKDMYTGNESDLLLKTGHFSILVGAKYTKKTDNLKRGDILLGTGHTAIVLDNGKNCTASVEKAKEKPFESFKVKIKRDEVKVRNGAGTGFRVNTVIRDKNIILEIIKTSGKNNNWGKLENGWGWVYLPYLTRI